MRCEDPLESGQDHSLGLGPEVHKTRKWAKQSALFMLCFLTVGAMGPAAFLHSFCGFPALKDYTLKLWAKVNPFNLRLFLSRIYHLAQKSTPDVLKTLI